MGRGEGARISDFFSKSPNLKKNLGGGGGGGGSRVSEFFFQRIQI